MLLPGSRGAAPAVRARGTPDPTVTVRPVAESTFGDNVIRVLRPLADPADLRGEAEADPAVAGQVVAGARATPALGDWCAQHRRDPHDQHGHLPVGHDLAS